MNKTNSLKKFMEKEEEMNEYIAELKRENRKIKEEIT